MENRTRRTNPPVLLLHNVDETWEPADMGEALKEVGQLEKALREEGHPVTSVPVYDADLGKCLRNYDPRDFIVLNWCDELPGLSRSEALVAESLETLRFTYTGSSPCVLAGSWDKGKVKQVLEQSRYSHASVAGFRCASSGWVGQVSRYRETSFRTFQLLPHE